MAGSLAVTALIAPAATAFPHASGCSGDVGNPDAVQQLVQQLQQRYENVDMVISNAGANVLEGGGYRWERPGAGTCIAVFGSGEVGGQHLGEVTQQSRTACTDAGAAGQWLVCGQESQAMTWALSMCEQGVDWRRPLLDGSTRQLGAQAAPRL